MLHSVYDYFSLYHLFDDGGIGVYPGGSKSTQIAPQAQEVERDPSQIRWCARIRGMEETYGGLLVPRLGRTDRDRIHDGLETSIKPAAEALSAIF